MTMQGHDGMQFSNGWTCNCDECADNRQAKPPTPAQLTQLADLIAERNRVGPKPEKPPKRGRLHVPADQLGW